MLAGLVILAALAYAVNPPFAALPVMLSAFTIFFFRDPERRAPAGNGLILAPADGRVMGVCGCDDPFVKRSVRLSIFMSVFDVHVNRSPIRGVVVRVEHTPGVRKPAYVPGGEEVRERNRIELSGETKLAVEQYAGVFARRIACFTGEGREVAAGGRIGMVKFGSRVDVIMPCTVEVKVSEGERVRCGETIVGVFDEKSQ